MSLGSPESTILGFSGFSGVVFWNEEPDFRFRTPNAEATGCEFRADCQNQNKSVDVSLLALILLHDECAWCLS